LALDGKLLARARDALAEIKRENEAETLRRQQQVYARCPEIRTLDRRLRALMLEVVGAAIREPSRPLAELQGESLALQARRAEKLTELGYGPDYLDDVVSCPKCGDTGFVSGRPCGCLLRLYEAEQARELSSLLTLGSERFENFSLDWYPAAAEPGAGEAPRARMERILKLCRSYAASFGPGSANLLFRGGTGLGKTFLSACVARSVAEQGFSVVYETVVSALEAMEAQKFSRRDEESESDARVRQLLGCDLLILDDLGTEMLTAFSASALYTIVNTRLITGKKTIVSTNLTAEELRRRYAPSLVSRLEGEYRVLEFLGRDIRLLKKQAGRA